MFEFESGITDSLSGFLTLAVVATVIVSETVTYTQEYKNNNYKQTVTTVTGTAATTVLFLCSLHGNLRFHKYLQENF